MGSKVQPIAVLEALLKSYVNSVKQTTQMMLISLQAKLTY